MSAALVGCERSKCEDLFNQNTKNSFQNCGGTTRSLPRDGGAEEFHGGPTVGPRPKIWAREAQMRDNPAGGELDPANDVCMRCKKNFPSVLFCIGKMTREGCNRGSEVGTFHSGRDGEGLVPLRKLKESGKNREL